MTNLINPIKYIFNRITCRHEYKQVCRVLATNKLSKKEVELNITYECVHCGKRISIEIFDNSNNK